MKNALAYLLWAAIADIFATGFVLFKSIYKLNWVKIKSPHKVYFKKKINK